MLAEYSPLLMYWLLFSGISLEGFLNTRRKLAASTPFAAFKELNLRRIANTRKKIAGSNIHA